MSGAVPPLAPYALMAQTGKTLPYILSCVLNVTSTLCEREQESKMENVHTADHSLGIQSFSVSSSRKIAGLDGRNLSDKTVYVL
jgi:hypothetical protein